MKRVALFIYILFLAISCKASQADDLGYEPCWLQGESGNFNISTWVLFRAWFLPINLDDPEGDVIERVSSGDSRFIAVGGFGMYFPSINTPDEYELVCSYGWRFFDKTGDAYETKEAAEKGRELKAYAKQYNSKLLKVLMDGGSQS